MVLTQKGLPDLPYQVHWQDPEVLLVVVLEKLRAVPATQWRSTPY